MSRNVKEASNPIDTNATLININDDCLLYICQFLNTYDISNLASTCYRLREFASSFLFPKIAKNLDLKVIVERETVLRWDSSTGTVDELRTQAIQFSNFVEHISVTGPIVNQSFCKQIGDFLSIFPNLKTLRLTYVHCNDVLKLLSNISLNLNELHWIDSSGMTDEFSVVIQRLSKLEKITVTGTGNKFTVALFERCKKLSYLDIELLYSQTGDLEKIFEENGHTLRILKLTNFEFTHSDEIFKLIAKKLPKLKKLGISDTMLFINPTFEHMELRYISILELKCGFCDINLLMQTLSGSEVLEELTIHYDSIYNVPTAESLTFKTLQNLYWDVRELSAASLNNITLAHMPALRNLQIYYKADVEEDDSNEIANLVDSKRSLTSICVLGVYEPSLIIVNIIEILKAATRPYLRLGIPYEIDEEEVIAYIQVLKFFLHVC